MNNFTLRAISGFFYAITVVGCILLSPTTLAMLMFVIAFFCAFEWARIHDASKPSAMGFGVYTWLFLSPFVANLTPLQAASIATIIALLWITHRLFTQGISALNHAKNLGLGILYIALPIYLFLLLCQSQHLASGQPHTPQALNYLTWPSGGFMSPKPGPDFPALLNAQLFARAGAAGLHPHLELRYLCLPHRKGLWKKSLTRRTIAQENLGRIHRWYPAHRSRWRLLFLRLLSHHQHLARRHPWSTHECVWDRRRPLRKRPQTRKRHQRQWQIFARSWRCFGSVRCLPVWLHFDVGTGPNLADDASPYRRNRHPLLNTSLRDFYTSPILGKFAYYYERS
jgi:hypothetical protein